jgi:molybdate transport system substrate-binding protein
VGRCLSKVLLETVLLLTLVTAVQASELQVIAGGGIAGPLNEIAALFERTSDHKVVIRYGTMPELITMATSGVPFDLGVVPEDVWKDAGARARVAPGPTRSIARVGIGVAVRAGAPKPDISTAAALKQTLLKAQSVASIPASATGAQLAAIYAQLGIADEMGAKTRAQPGPKQIVEAVADGDAELAVFLVNVLIDPRLDIVGPFPPDVQREVVYTVGLSANSKQPQTANAFIALLLSPPAIAVIRAKGMSPG